MKLILKVSLLFCCGFTFSNAQTRTSEKPNVILILADDLGYNDVSVYRKMHPAQVELAPTSQTPNIDKLAEQGMMFTNFYAGAAVCSPSRSALITGRNASRVGIYNWIPENSPMHLRAEEVTIAEMLKEEGYATGHFGKWHLTSQGTDQPLPNEQGFDYSFYAYNNAIPSHRNPENYFRNGEAVGKLEGYACQLVVDETIEWLERKKDNNAGSEPFYLNVWFNEPHLKVAAPEELTKRHAYNQEYYGAIENMDLAVGRLMEYLKQNNLEEETIVIFTSDNGSRWDHSNDPLRGEKCFNFEGGIRVPFIIRWPANVPDGSSSDVAGSFTDVLPSLAEFTAASLPTGCTIDGVSLVPVFTGAAPQEEREDPIFFYRYFHDPICMLREGDWCLLGYKNLIPYAESLNEGELANIRPWHFQENHMEYLDGLEPEHFELYNLRTDKEQQHNLAKAHPERVKQMKAKMLQLRNEMVREGGDWYK
ncbi:arylsulfatase A [Catalinimonas alkaloidigena]|uniref:sulfatase-like hydrolase/transferase n=1 Tax=Catalinimonas alkaloidigena TaxID=1075417 RepID=UPI0024075719|nr:sulfatase-like hydrolase/transferase [Catalinimonas alkaloidigena]MDF9799616.1 arylsulfatase A [Catalinimonas alkaloidigena]